MSLLLTYGLPDPERVTKDGVGPQGYCSGIFPEPQGIRNEKGKAEVKSSGSEFTSYNSQCPEPPHSGSWKQQGEAFLSSPSRACCRSQKDLQGGQAWTGWEEQGHFAPPLPERWTGSTKRSSGGTSFTGDYSSHQLLLTAQWLSDQTCTWHLSGLWVIDQPYVSTPIWVSELQPPWTVFHF